MKRIVIFDLDETIVDSAHRTPNHPDGTLNLPLYLSLKTRENTLKDGLLPLANFWKSLDLSENYVIVCTARTWADFDQEFLDMHGLVAHKILHRAGDGSENSTPDGKLKRKWLGMLNLKQFKKLPAIMFDDANKVISEIRSMGIVCLNAHKVNAKLSA
jgi:phosphoglycolate phosphatase-like HAD superfamily hydrolase